MISAKSSKSSKTPVTTGEIAAVHQQIQAPVRDARDFGFSWALTSQPVRCRYARENSQSDWLAASFQLGCSLPHVDTLISSPTARRIRQVSGMTGLLKTCIGSVSLVATGACREGRASSAVTG